jgi:ABC-2 type transport system permease protein
MLGPLLHAPAWLMDLSPFEHVPAVPATALAAGPLLALTAIAIALTGTGLVAFSRRDVG